MNSFTPLPYFCARYQSLSDAVQLPVPTFKFDARCHQDKDCSAISTGLFFLGGDNFSPEKALVAGVSIGEQLQISTNLPRVHQGDNQCAYLTDDTALLVYWANESDYSDMTALSQSVYARLLQDAQKFGYPHMVRVWNYFGDINGEQHGLERYRHFCLGRFEALSAQNISDEDYPSACALGHQGGEFLVYALVSKTAPQHFENPRQAAAYHYPSEYGPRSPSFARASVLAQGDSATLFLSGTASVVGHETLHADNVDGQIATTLENIRILIDHIAQQTQQDYPGAWQAQVLKVYVRHQDDVGYIQQKIRAAYPDVPTVYVHADICRKDLLLEIDGLWNLAR